MSALREALGDYLEMRHALGYRLERQARLLDSFVGLLDARGLDHVQSAVALDFSIGGGAVPRGEASRRLSAIRLFSRYLAALDELHEVPPSRLLPAVVERKAPYLYSDEELAALLAAARRIEEPFRALSMWTLIGLLACSGLRPGEAVGLSPADVDLATGVITVRDSKWGSSRLVPLHASATDALSRYESVCAALFGPAGLGGSDDQPRFFMWSARKPLCMSAATASFRKLLRQAGIVAATGRRPPRLYDLRHRFAVRTLVGWYRDGVDVGQALPVLSAYLGHQQPKDTYWYLQAVPELLQAAADRLEACFGEENR
jgi:integrase/recombinase XerD